LIASYLLPPLDTEPLGLVLCHGPLTSLHRVLPTASVGYSVFDLIDGVPLGPAFMAHGAVMFMFSTYVMEVNKNEVLAVMLALEVSFFLQIIIRLQILRHCCGRSKMRICWLWETCAACTCLT
jgi:hypothetical protein